MGRLMEVKALFIDALIYGQHMNLKQYDVCLLHLIHAIRIIIKIVEKSQTNFII